MLKQFCFGLVLITLVAANDQRTTASANKSKLGEACSDDNNCILNAQCSYTWPKPGRFCYCKTSFERTEMNTCKKRSTWCDSSAECKGADSVCCIIKRSDSPNDHQCRPKQQCSNPIAPINIGKLGQECISDDNCKIPNAICKSYWNRNTSSCACKTSFVQNSAGNCEKRADWCEQSVDCKAVDTVCCEIPMGDGPSEQLCAPKQYCYRPLASRHIGALGQDCDSYRKCNRPNSECSSPTPLTNRKICFCKPSFSLNAQGNCEKRDGWCEKSTDCRAADSVCCEIEKSDGSSDKLCQPKQICPRQLPS